MPTPPPPTERLSQLSLGSMPPTTRLQIRAQQDNSSESEGSSSDSGFDEATGNIIFPSKLIYSLRSLDGATRGLVIDAVESPTQVVLQGCAANDKHGMLFQVSELVEYHIRTGIGSNSTPGCSCGDDKPCRHVLWLFDQITRQMLPEQDGPLILKAEGYAEELKSPYDRIAQFHLDVLAESMHSQLSSSTDDDEPPNPRRVQEVREILASLNSSPIDEYRPDLFTNPKKGKKVVKRQDLECTIFRMMLDNNEFFQYFLSNMAADELVKNRFRRLEQRADNVLQGSDAYSRGQSAYDKPKTVAWCANHLLLVVRQVEAIIQHTKVPLAEWESRAAARTLVHILEQVVLRNNDVLPANRPREERNLFFRLIGQSDIDFVVGTLASIPPDSISPLVGNLEQVEQETLKHGVHQTWVDKLRRIIARARGSSGAFSWGSKRQGGGQDRRAKRMK